MMNENAIRDRDPVSVFESLRQTYLSYYNTPFGLRDRQIEAERTAVLNRDGGIFREPLLELRPEYETAGQSITDSVTESGADPDLGTFATLGLLQSGLELYKHQEATLIQSVKERKNVVITAGTGSGKTESFLLPVLSSLLSESRTWASGAALGNNRQWWRDSARGFESQRSGETGRSAAVRTLILYPMNALVDDQMVRLRRALDSPEVHQWLDTHRKGHRFYFGRYTGSTPVSGQRRDTRALRDLRRYLQQTEQRRLRAESVAFEKQDEAIPYFVPSLDGSEMRSRWDMQDFPPDVLITNFSMLNVMLRRRRDASLFSQTAQWLEESPDHVFTLVVDELHTYRGTAGTEVAYLLKVLRSRLRVKDPEQQIRIVAASASLAENRDEQYLADFFALPRESFSVVPGSLKFTDPTLQEKSMRAADIVRANDDELKELLETGSYETGLRRVFEFTDDDERKMLRALSQDEVASRLFPQDHKETAHLALQRVLQFHTSHAGPASAKFRAHYFFRNIPGIWACSNPDCTRIDPGSSSDRSIGKVFGEPETRCDCGARILELLYCQRCGEVFLGGFTPHGETQQPGPLNVDLFADVPELARLPDQTTTDRTPLNYVVYWPKSSGTMSTSPLRSWQRNHQRWSFEFVPVRYDPMRGQLRATTRQTTGIAFRVTSNQGADDAMLEEGVVKPFPTICPSCGDDWEITHDFNGSLPFGDSRRYRSPIRNMRTGFEKVNQVLAADLLSSIPKAERRAIVFTDSRQDAAKLSAGINLRHYQDLIRLLLYRQAEMSDQSQQDVELARSFYVDKNRSQECRDAIDRLQAVDLQTLNALTELWIDGSGDIAEETRLIAGLVSPSSLDQLVVSIERSLLSLGLNPGGPSPSLQTWSRTGSGEEGSWTDLFVWTDSQPRVAGSLTTVQQTLLGQIEASLRDEILKSLVSGAGRDFESLGLGWLTLKSDRESSESSDEAVGIMRSSIRILADLRMFEGQRNGRPDPPRRLRDHWVAIEHAGGPSASETEAQMRLVFGDSVRDYVLMTKGVVLRRAASQSWSCTNCRRQHLVFGSGLCTLCNMPLPKTSLPVTHESDYYSLRASAGLAEPLRSAELTGQTGRLDAQARQMRFQDVFMDTSEVAQVDSLELLSVTTTMEAGVDIGALSVVMLGNMPPTRFNYQQRVGRAGRRDNPVAIALTVCRGRSHDEYYFDNPDLIVNAPTPAPYLTLGQLEIAQRAIDAEILTTAFRDLETEFASVGLDVNLEGNVHGEFGSVSDWPVISQFLQAWLQDKTQEIQGIVEHLLQFTPLHEQAQEIAKATQASLFRRVDTVATSSMGHSDLSQRLANAGVLPMFGFPTSVRYLFARPPRYTYPWPPDSVIDRDLAMAISQFSPKSEIVKDGKVLPVVGIAAFRPRGNQVDPVVDPLETGRRIEICRSCSYVVSKPLQSSASGLFSCPKCGAPPGEYSEMEMREPQGFRAAPAHDFDGNFSWSSRSIAARVHTDLSTLDVTRVDQAHVLSGRGKRLALNDNNGRLHEFRRGSDSRWSGYVSVEAADAGLISNESGVGGTEIRVALGTEMVTDVMFLGTDSPVDRRSGFRVNWEAVYQPSGVPDPSFGRRAAWYSLAFAVRAAAIRLLDIDDLELTAGIFSTSIDDVHTPYAFLADTLENGAGFSSALGRADMAKELVEHVRLLIDKWSSPSHSDACFGSCYRCLRDYRNMAFHALLDWRLARDLLDFVLTKGFTNDERVSERALEAWVRANNASIVQGSSAPSALFETIDGNRFGLVIKHPFEAAETTVMSERLARAQVDLEIANSNLQTVLFVDYFTLDRAPRIAHELTREFNTN